MTNTECDYCSYPATFVVSETGVFACRRCAFFEAEDGYHITFV